MRSVSGFLTRANRGALGVWLILLWGSSGCDGSAGDHDAGAPVSDAGFSPIGEDGGATPDGGTYDGGESVPPPAWANDFFPMEIGLEWRYRMTRSDGAVGDSCENNGSMLTHRMAETTADGAVRMSVTPACFYDSLTYARDAQYTYVDGYRHLSLPPELGVSWAAGGASGASFAWTEHYDSYEVEAGTFQDCFRASQQGYDNWSIYCRGVGMVLAYGNVWQSYRWELVSKSF